MNTRDLSLDKPGFKITIEARDKKEDFPKKDILMRFPTPLVYLLDEKADAEGKSRAEVAFELLWASFDQDEVQRVKKELPELRVRKPGRSKKVKVWSYTNKSFITQKVVHPKKGEIFVAPGETVECEL